MDWSHRVKMGNKGEIHLLMCLSLSIFASLVALFCYQGFERYLALKDRFKTHLCFKRQSRALKRYSTKMIKLNTSIKRLHTLSLIPAPQFKWAVVALKSALMIQNGVHVSYVKNIFKMPQCTRLQAGLFLKNIPFATIGRLKLRRNAHKQAKIGKKKWRITMQNTQLTFALTGLFVLNPPSLKAFESPPIRGKPNWVF